MRHAGARLQHHIPMRGTDPGDFTFEQFEQFKMNAQPDFTPAGAAVVQALARDANFHGAHPFLMHTRCHSVLPARCSHPRCADPAHRDTCSKNRDGEDCRFNHPHEPCERTSVSLHEVNGEQALRLALERNLVEIYMTSYNVWIMMAVPGNNNVRAVVDPSCTFYVTGAVVTPCIAPAPELCSHVQCAAVRCRLHYKVYRKHSCESVRLAAPYTPPRGAQQP